MVWRQVVWKGGGGVERGSEVEEGGGVEEGCEV